MKVNEIKVTKRITTGEYQFEEVTVCLESGYESDVDVVNCIAQTKKEIVDGLAKEIKEKKEGKNANSKTNTSKVNGKDGKDSSKKNEGSDDEGAEDDETSKSEASDDDNGESEGSESGEESGEDEGSEETEETTKGKSGKGKGESKGKADSKETSAGKDQGKEGRKFKKKPQHYDRSIEQHKEIFSGVLRSVAPDWKKSEESKKKAKKVSEAVEGEPFLDENGEVLADFKAKVKKQMK